MCSMSTYLSTYLPTPLETQNNIHKPIVNIANYTKNAENSIYATAKSDKIDKAALEIHTLYSSAELFFRCQ